METNSPDIEYIKGKKTIVADTISILTLNGNQYVIQKSTYGNEIVSETNNTK